jgi:trk system potassium uptake protein TrkA
MKIIICGAGKVGIAVAKQLLLNTDNDITIVDSIDKNLSIARNLDVQTICGVSSSPEVLDLAGATYADMIICVTKSDEVNILTSHIASTLFGVKMKIARIRSPMYIQHKWLPHIYNKSVIAIDHIISPEIAVAKHIVEMLGNTGIENNFPVDQDKYSIISIIAGLNLEDKTVCDIKKQLEIADIEDFSMCFIRRNEQVICIKNETIIQKGDEIYILTENKEIATIIRSLTGHSSRLKNIVICGCGEIGFHIAQILQNHHFNVTIIEKDEDRCNFLSDNLNSSLVIHGNMQEREVLQECGNVDAIISVSGRDETNLFTSLIAKNLGISECFTLIDEHNYYDVFQDLAMSNIINTRDITISQILNYIGEKSAIKQKTICDGAYSICAFTVAKTSVLNGLEVAKISDIKMNVLGIIRNENLEHKVEKFAEQDVVVGILPFQFVTKLEKLVV